MRRWRQLALGTGLLGAGLATLIAQENPLDQFKDHRDENAATTQDAPADPLASKPENRSENELTAYQKSIDAYAGRLTDDDIRRAIARGCDYLVRRFANQIENAPSSEQGQWRFAGDQEVGVVSIALYACLEAHRTVDDPRLASTSAELKPVVEWLMKAKTDRTYSAGLQACAISMLPNAPEYRNSLKQIRDAIVAGVRDDGAFGYSISGNERSPQWWDNSNSQYALLGIWAVADAGMEVPQRFWRASEAHWRTTQDSSGGWGYRTTAYGEIRGRAQGAARPTMTAAGVASLFVTLDQLGAESRVDSALEKGLRRVEDDFAHNSYRLDDSLYYCYAVQRVGVASGLKNLGEVNWFRRTAASLLQSQRQDGTWMYWGSSVAGTSLAVLFLCHGGAPVAFNKLQYGEPTEWCAYPRDDARFTTWLSHNIERPLNWQIVNHETPAAEWLDAPILLITGKGVPQLTLDDLVKLRTFINAGGIVLSVSQDNDATFTQWARAAAGRVVDDKYEMRILPPDHPLYTLDAGVKTPIGMMGLSNGVREMWVHSPVDIARSWSLREYARSEHFIVPQNLYAYAAGRTRLRSRLDTLAVTVDKSIPAIVHTSMGRLAYPGNDDPEPGAWPRFAAQLRNDSIDLQLAAVALDKLDAKKIPVVHMTGTAKFTLNDQQVAQLTKFLEDGGTLIADAAGGSDPFTQSFTDLAKRLIPNSQAQVLPQDHPLFSARVPGGSNIKAPDYRRFTPASRRQQDRPEIWAWSLKERVAILFSPLDLTAGLVGTHTWGISGYAPQYTTQLTRNLVLFAFNQNNLLPAQTVPAEERMPPDPTMPAAPATAPAP